MTFSCSKEMDYAKPKEQKENGFVEMSFNTSVDPELTKTIVVDGTDIYFQSTDHISIFDGDGNKDFAARIPGGASQAANANFIGKALEVDTYYALYPYTATATLDGATIKGVTIPVEQTAVASTFDPAANPSVCASVRDDEDNLTLSLKNVGSYLKFTVPSGKTYSKVVLISNDAGAIAGTVDVTVSSTDAPAINVVEPSNKVTLTGNMVAGSTYYVVVLPTTLTGGLTMEFYTDDKLLGNRYSKNALTTNRSKVKNLGEVKPKDNPNYPVVPGAFTINAAGDKVFFAKGNLQYQASSSTWRFAPNQWDYLGNNTEIGGNTTSSGRDTQEKWIDLFGFGCTGIRHEGMSYNSYQPWATSIVSQDYYKQEAKELSVTNYTDWGYLFSDANNEWFTLSKDEWLYLNNSRPNRTNETYIKTGSKCPYYAYIEVEGVKGDIYFADDWTYDKWPSDVKKPDYFNSCGSRSTTYGSYSAEEFAKIEATGVVFFPLTGYREGTNFSLRRGGTESSDDLGFYWTRTPVEASSYGVYIFTSGDGRISKGNEQTAIGANQPRGTQNDAHEGYAVRLVRRAKYVE